MLIKSRILVLVINGFQSWSLVGFAIFRSRLIKYSVNIRLELNGFYFHGDLG